MIRLAKSLGNSGRAGLGFAARGKKSARMLVALVGAAFSSSSRVGYVTPQSVDAALKLGGAPFVATPWYRRRDAAAKAVVDWGESVLAEPHARTDPVDPQYAFFRWIPAYVASVKLGATTHEWDNSCFGKTQAHFNGTAVTFTFSGAKVGPFSECADSYMIATVDGLALAELSSFLVVGTGTVAVAWNATTATGVEKSAVEWDLLTKGVRIFRFLNGAMQTISDIIDTAKLFASEAVKEVPNATAQLNMAFLSTYTPFTMRPRPGGAKVHFAANEIRSGDFFGIVRLDGVDPLLAWAMGSTTGHTTVALWKRGKTAAQDALFVCESTATSAYWAKNGVQCTPYEQWLLLADAAGYNVVLLPLSDHASAAFDEALVWLWLEAEILGTDYGYHAMLWSWIDTLKDNYPCTAPDFKVSANSTCLAWETLEILGPLLDKFLPSLGFGALFIKEAWAHRLGIRDSDWNSSLSVIYHKAGQQGVDLQVSFLVLYRYSLRESCSQFDSLPLTYSTCRRSRRWWSRTAGGTTRHGTTRASTTRTRWCAACSSATCGRRAASSPVPRGTTFSAAS